MVAGYEVALARAAELGLERTAEEVGDVARTEAELHCLPVDDGQRATTLGGSKEHVVEPVVAVHRRARQTALRPAAPVAAKSGAGRLRA